MEGETWGDASAALGIIHRNGSGTTRHIQPGLLWIQQTAARKRFKFGHVFGKENLVDLFTKYLDWTNIEHHARQLHCEFASRRAQGAATLHIMSRSMDQCEPRGVEREWGRLIVITRAMSASRVKKTRGNEMGNGNYIYRNEQYVNEGNHARARCDHTDGCDNITNSTDHLATRTERQHINNATKTRTTSPMAESTGRWREARRSGWLPGRFAPVWRRVNLGTLRR